MQSVVLHVTHVYLLNVLKQPRFWLASRFEHLTLFVAVFTLQHTTSYRTGVQESGQFIRLLPLLSWKTELN